MQSIQFTQYGSPDVLELVEIDKPIPTDDQILIKIHAASANPLDWHIMRGAPILARFEFGLRKPKINQLGADIAGTVESIGRNVSEFSVGDRVFGDLSFGNLGGFAEYVCASPDSVALIPDNLSFAEAAAMPVVGFTALQGLRDKGQIQAGQKVLVNGASGGVGSAAVQIAKSYGAEVTGVCSTRNLELVCSIGADHAIDYTRQDFTRMGQQYDLIYDAVGNRSAADYARALTPNGICAIAGFTTLPHMFLQVMFLGSLRSMTTSKTIGMMATAHPNKKDLLILRDLLETGKVKAVIDRHYPLSETADAIRYLETSRVQGKVIIDIV